MTFLELYGNAAVVIFSTVVCLWLVSVQVRNASIIDWFWGPLFVAVAWWLLWLQDTAYAKPFVATLLVTAWGLRLCFHLVNRHLGQGEDKRYRLWREHGGSNWPLITLPKIFLFQGAIALVVCSPLIAAHYVPQPWTWVTSVGVLVAIAGFLYELVADVQLNQHKADRNPVSDILEIGLWRYSRHPNYFGDAVFWWGIGIVGLSFVGWWSLIGPAVMTGVFIAISNDVLERGMLKRHKDYADYVTNTPKFFPRFSSR